jgi:hypothetical protein
MLRVADSLILLNGRRWDDFQLHGINTETHENQPIGNPMSKDASTIN